MLGHAIAERGSGSFGRKLVATFRTAVAGSVGGSGGGPGGGGGRRGGVASPGRRARPGAGRGASRGPAGPRAEAERHGRRERELEQDERHLLRGAPPFQD